jgi:hypothetical protein
MTQRSGVYSELVKLREQADPVNDREKNAKTKCLVRATEWHSLELLTRFLTCKLKLLLQKLQAEKGKNDTRLRSGDRLPYFPKQWNFVRT